LITGRCLCGAVRYRTSRDPLVARVCWCRLCQYLGAGSGTVNVCFKTESFEVTGETRDYVSIADSGNEMHRKFCAVCGTPMFSEAASRPHLIFVRAGTLDDASVVNPAMTIWTSQAPAWACFDGKIPTVEGQPPPAA
jgi:hypothetical protein